MCMYDSLASILGLVNSLCDLIHPRVVLDFCCINRENDVLIIIGADFHTEIQF